MNLKIHKLRAASDYGLFLSCDSHSRNVDDKSVIMQTCQIALQSLKCTITKAIWVAVWSPEHKCGFHDNSDYVDRFCDHWHEHCFTAFPAFVTHLFTSKDIAYVLNSVTHIKSIRPALISFNCWWYFSWNILNPDLQLYEPQLHMKSRKVQKTAVRK